LVYRVYFLKFGTGWSAICGSDAQETIEIHGNAEVMGLGDSEYSALEPKMQMQKTASLRLCGFAGCKTSKHRFMIYVIL